MTLRRYTPLRQSRGTVIPEDVRRELRERDQGRCVGPLVGMPGECSGSLDADHVRASGALGKKSPTTLDNLVLLCRFTHHRAKTEAGRVWRPKLLAYLARVS
ncbi:MAG: HNH endonuclease [Gemmatimonadetes bacterium]|nr:HNH endonuclease [Gemmatimonadota bacterium]